MKNQRRNDCGRVLISASIAVGLLCAGLLAYYLLWGGNRQPLVVYCAHDSIYADSVLQEFQKRTGIPVAAKYDTEATKSLGLVELLMREKDHPRCDVFWNNELLGTVDLKDKGLLLSYKGPGYARIPESFRDPDGCWTGFAARLRVYIVNTDRLPATEQSVARALEGDLSRCAIAKPLYGTTLTHYCALWRQWGEERLKAWHRDWRGRSVREVTGNAHVKNLVAGGICDLGLTDTDDFFLAKAAGQPVAALPVRLEDGSTICIPNTASIIRGTRRLAQAQRLVDYLLSEECETALANSESRQVPLGPVEQGQLPPEVRELARWAAQGAPLAELGPVRAACLAWLKAEYLR